MIRKLGIKGYNCIVKLKGFINHIFLVFLLFVGKQTLYAQNYPVQANLNLIAPYSAQLSTYPAYQQSLSIQLLNKDFATPQINVYLKLNIEGPGISIGTAPFFKPNSPINLVAGSPTLLGGADIAYLFNTDNLIFSGLNKTKFINEGSLLP